MSHKSTSIWSQVRVTVDTQKKSAIASLLIFLFIGITGFLTQLFLPYILELSGLEIIGLPDPSIESVFLDVWGDYLFTGVFLIIFLGSTTFSSNIGVDKQIYTLLARPISRENYYFITTGTRLLVLLLIISITTFTVFLLALFYFEPIEFAIIFWGNLLLSLSLMSLLSIQMMINTRLTTASTAGLGVVILIISLTINLFAGFLDWLVWFSPVSLSSAWQQILLKNDYNLVLERIIALLAWVLVPYILGMYMFKSRDL